MVNQIIVDSKQNNKVILANSVDSGSNEFILRWLCDLHRIPRIIIGGETYIPTSEDYMLKIPVTMWTGSSYFLVTIKDTRATTELKIYRVADTEGNISMRIMGDNSYRLMKVTSGEAGEYDNFLSLTSINAVQNKVITARLDEVFIYVSNGKSAVASAITDKGIPTEPTDTFTTMADNIRAIPSGGGVVFDLIDFDFEIVTYSILQ